jgi:hypothetical protein
VTRMAELLADPRTPIRDALTDWATHHSVELV